MPRLVQKGDCRLESYLDGILMIFAHRDMPGVIGKVGNVFGRHRVNIAQMSVGRATNKPGGEAIGVLALDSAPPAEALAEVLAMDEVDEAWIVKLPAGGRDAALAGRVVDAVESADVPSAAKASPAKLRICLVAFRANQWPKTIETVRYDSLHQGDPP